MGKLKSLSKYRKDYELTWDEMRRLSNIVQMAPDMKAARSSSNEVWKKLGEELGFHWETVGQSTELPDNPKHFSAIPKDAEMSEEEMIRAGITLEIINK